MLAIQTDIVSALDRFCAERFVYAIDHTRHPPSAPRRPPTSCATGTAHGHRLSRGHYCVLFARSKLEELLLKPKLGDDWKHYQWFMKPVWLEERAHHQPARWLPSGLRRLRRTADRRGGERCQRCQTATRALSCGSGEACIGVDIQHPFWSHFPILKRCRTRPAAAVRRRADHQAGGAALRAVGAADCGFRPTSTAAHSTS